MDTSHNLTARRGRKKMTHKLWEVFKHPAPFNGEKWAVQCPNGIVTFRTKKTAQYFADQSNQPTY